MIDSPIKKGTEHEAWEYWYPLVFGYFYRRVNKRHDVEDLTANTLNALFLKKDVQNPKGFIWQTARNQLYKYITQKQTEFSTINIDEYEHLTGQWKEEVEELDIPNSAHFESKLEQLKACLNTHLEGDDLAIVTLAINENKNSTEIGEELHIKPATVRQKIRRSFLKLKESCNSLWLELSI